LAGKPVDHFFAAFQECMSKGEYPAENRALEFYSCSLWQLSVYAGKHMLAIAGGIPARLAS
jgi:hypothetical protein